MGCPVSTLLPTTSDTLSPPLVYCNEGVFIMFINKVLELYREACKHGLSVSLSINNMNGQESFSLATVPEEDVDREDADRTNKSVAQEQPNQLLSRPPMPLSSDHRHRRFSLPLLSALSILALL